jgi:phage terminase Nu1 subunit (DNA packaging protein)
MATEEIPRIVSKTALAAFFGVDRSVLTSWEKKGMPCVKKGGGGGVHGVYSYDLRECCEWRFGAKEQDPDRMIPTDRKAWFESEVKRRALQERDRELIPAKDVERTIATTFAALASDMRAIPDMLERRHGVSGAVAELVEEGLNEAMNGMADRLIELCDEDVLLGEPGTTGASVSRETIEQ